MSNQDNESSLHSPKEGPEETPKRRLSEVLAGYEGLQLFKTPEEVDAYLCEERDSWE